MSTLAFTWRPWFDADGCGLEHARGCHGHLRHATGDRAAGSPCGKAPRQEQDFCASHGATKALSEKRKAEEQQRKQLASFLRGIITPPEVDPTQALLNLIAWKYAEVEWWRERVQSLEPGDLTWGEVEYSAKTGGDDWGTKRTQRAAVNVALAEYHKCEDQLATFTAKAIAAGIEERRIRISESIGATVIAVIRAIGNDVATALQQAGAPQSLVDVFRVRFDDSAHHHLVALRSPDPTKQLPRGKQP